MGKQARVKSDVPHSMVQAHTGRTYVRYEWRYVPESEKPCPLLDYQETAVSQTIEISPDGGMSEVEPTLSEKSVRELKALAKDAGIPGYSKMSKGDLVKALSNEEER